MLKERTKNRINDFASCGWVANVLNCSQTVQQLFVDRFRFDFCHPVRSRSNRAVSATRCIRVWCPRSTVTANGSNGMRAQNSVVGRFPYSGSARSRKTRRSRCAIYRGVRLTDTRLLRTAAQRAYPTEVMQVRCVFVVCVRPRGEHDRTKTAFDNSNINIRRVRDDRWSPSTTRAEKIKREAAADWWRARVWDARRREHVVAIFDFARPLVCTHVCVCVCVCRCASVPLCRYAHGVDEGNPLKYTLFAYYICTHTYGHTRFLMVDLWFFPPFMHNAFAK